MIIISRIEKKIILVGKKNQKSISFEVGTITTIVGNALEVSKIEKSDSGVSVIYKTSNKIEEIHSSIEVYLKFKKKPPLTFSL